jgi:hypothetical protein
MDRSALICPNPLRPRASRLNRFAPKVCAVKLQQVESVEKDVPPLALATQPFEHSQPIASQATASPSIRHDRTRKRFMPQRLADTAAPSRGRRESTAECRWDHAAPSAGTVVLDLVNPVRAARRVVGGGRWQR